MNIRELTNNVVQPRMAKIKLNPGDTLYTEQMMREAVNAAVTQVVKDIAQGADEIFKEIQDES